ncbi:MAG TPA: acyl-CoA dehydrogenase family protein [Blastocatellia bacterium]|nr:acyl-CoA dehydrogenase family protein [Blastocatellia bacterium]
MAGKLMDFFGLEESLADDERLAMQSVREFVEAEVKPLIADYYERGEFPTSLIAKLGDLGVLGANLPSNYGCAGMSNVAYGLVMQELEAGDSGVRSFASVQGALCMYPIFAFGSESQRQEFLPRMAEGKVIGCFGLTEPNFGSNPAGMATRARRVVDGWVINGSKAWITNGNIADIAIVWAKIEDGTIQGFIVEQDSEGFKARETKHKLSLRASVTSELLFEDCFVPENRVLPGGVGLKAPLMCLTQARYGIAWGALGAARDCFETAVDYARERVQFSRPIAGYQLTQEKLAKMYTEICKAQLLCLQLGRMKDAGKLKPVHVSMAKMNNVAMALECARVSRSILGANGIVGESPIMRHMCNLESVYTYEGTHEIHLLVLGQHITGINAFE